MTLVVIRQMRRLINYILSCFCCHEWELIFDVIAGVDSAIENKHHVRTCRCTKCDYSKNIVVIGDYRFCDGS